MDLQENLIESSDRTGRKRKWKPYLGSLVMHALLIALILFLSMTSVKNVKAEQKPIRAYLTQGAAPPPPPPPPPPAPAKSSGGGPKPVKLVTQLQLPSTPKFITPVETPKEVPQPVQTPSPQTLKIDDESSLPQPMMSSSSSSEGSGSGDSTSTAGVAGGVPGGVAGGVVGGVVGGQIGGEKGGVVGGQLGGQLGGTGSGTAGNGSEGTDGPLRVGGDVKAPTAISKPEPKYTEAARHAHITGVVVVEAVINRQGTVEEVHVLKGLPMGLSEEAVQAVKQWRFHPGTLNGQPVDVIFSLTVNFKMD